MTFKATVRSAPLKGCYPEPKFAGSSEGRTLPNVQMEFHASFLASLVTQIPKAFHS